MIIAKYCSHRLILVFFRGDQRCKYRATNLPGGLYLLQTELYDWPTAHEVYQHVEEGLSTVLRVEGRGVLLGPRMSFNFPHHDEALLLNPD